MITVLLSLSFILKFFILSSTLTSEFLFFSAVHACWLMSQSSPTGYISSPGNPGENFFERANPGYPDNFFYLIPLPRSKNDGRIPGGGAKFSQTRRNCSLSLQKILKKTTRVQFFYLESLTKPLYFKLKQNHSKVLSPTLIFN